MKEIATGVYQLSGFPPNAINVFLAGDVLIDAGSRFAASRILKQIQGRNISAVSLTHGHGDHQGSAKAVCDARKIPLWCPQGDADAVESGDLLSLTPDNGFARFSVKSFGGPAHPVAKRLGEGDEVAGFRVIDTPGHSPGHIAYWRESDGTLILGDVLNGMHLVTGIPGLHEPPTAFTVDPATNRGSARRIAELNPKVVCFGHGPPLRDTQKLLDFVASLPT